MMSSAPTLGPIAFAGFEVPEKIAFGGKQKLVVHMMPGGGRVVDVMGPDDAPIKWSGVFSGLNAAERVRTLEGLRRAGSPMLLVWDGWRFRVIIDSFEVQVTNSSWIPYSIELCVVPSIADTAIDWLAAAVAPTLTLAALQATALDQAIISAGVGLASIGLAQTVAASGQLAQYATQRAFAGSVA